MLYGDFGPELFEPVVGSVPVGFEDPPPLDAPPPPPPLDAPPPPELLPPDELLDEPDEPPLGGGEPSEDPLLPVPVEDADVPVPLEPESVAGLEDWMLYVTGTTSDGVPDFRAGLAFVCR